MFFNLPKHLGCNSNFFSFGWDPIGLPKRVCMFFVDGEHSAFDSRIDTVDGSEILHQLIWRIYHFHPFLLCFASFRY